MKIIKENKIFVLFILIAIALLVMSMPFYNDKVYAYGNTIVLGCQNMDVNNIQWYKNWRKKEASKPFSGTEEKEKINLIILIDESGSMISNKMLNYISIVVNNFANTLNEDDKLGVVRYANNSHILKKLSTDKKLSDSFFTPVGTLGFGNSEINAFDTALNMFVEEKDWAENIIVLISDGMIYTDNPNYAQKEKEILVDSGIKVYNVILGMCWQYALNLSNNTSAIPYMFDVTNAPEPGNPVIEPGPCVKKEYAEANPGECCIEYPETCCFNDEFINDTDNWHQFFEMPGSEWRKDVCCEQKEFSQKNVSKCPFQNSCKNEDYFKENTCKCEGFTCSNFISCPLGAFLYKVYQWIKIIVVVLLIVLGILDFVKASGANNPDQMKKFQNDFVKRALIVAVFLFGPLILNFLLGLISGGEWSTCGIK